MICIIIAKHESTRCPNKNWREFYYGRSLVDIAIDECKPLGFKHIILSCDSEERREVADRHGIGFHLRPGRLAANETPMCEVFTETLKDLGAADEWRHDQICWRQVVDPLFSLDGGTAAMLDAWRNRRGIYDSAVACYERRGYYLDANHCPIGWGWGQWQPPSTELPQTYVMPFTCTIMTGEAAIRIGHMVGRMPLWVPFDHPTVDIDTVEDFELARTIYAQRAASGS